MKNNLAERLERVLMQDKSVNPQNIMPVLKADLRDVLREYAELKGDITLQVQDTIDGYNIILIANATRFKA